MFLPYPSHRKYPDLYSIMYTRLQLHLGPSTNSTNHNLKCPRSSHRSFEVLRTNTTINMNPVILNFPNQQSFFFGTLVLSSMWLLLVWVTLVFFNYMFSEAQTWFPGIFIAEEVEGAGHKGSGDNTTSWYLWKTLQQLNELTHKINSWNCYAYWMLWMP